MEKMTTKIIKRIMALAITTITVIGMPAVGASANWRQNNNGWWNLKGNGYSIGWERIGGNWFYFNQNGYMKTGWIKDGDKWYFLNPNGNMKTGWVKDGDNWYLLSPNGDMKTGWIKDGDKWYFLTPNGNMAHDITIDGYKLNSDGTWTIDDLTTTSTTGAAVVVPIDNINPTSTTSAAVTVPSDNDDENYFDKDDNQKGKLGNLLYKYNKKLDKQAERIENQEYRAWKLFGR